MANKDFAKVQSPENKANNISMWRNGLLLLTVVLLIGMSFMAGFQSGTGKDKTHQDATNNTRLQAQIEKQQQELEVLKHEVLKKETPVKPKSDTTDEVGTLTFYEALPNQSVNPAPMHTSQQAVHPAVKPIHTSKPHPKKHKKISHIVKVKPPVKVTSHKKKGIYRVQVGAYQQRDEAVRFRKNLKKKTGIHSRINHSSNKGKKKWYRVSVGSFSSRSSAEKTIKIIQKKMHIQGFILREQ